MNVVYRLQDSAYIIRREEQLLQKLGMWEMNSVEHLTRIQKT